MPRLLTFRSSLLLLCALLCLATGAGTQTSNTSPRTINLDFTLRPGETRLEGTIRKIDRARQQFTLEVDILVAGDSTAGDLIGPGLHIISVDDATAFGNRKTGNLELTLDNLVLGADAIIIGQAANQDGLIQARLVAVSVSKSAPTLPEPQTGIFLNPGRLAIPPTPTTPRQVAPRRVPPVPVAAHAPPRSQQPKLRPAPQLSPSPPIHPLQPTLAMQPLPHHAAQRAAPKIATALPHATVVAQPKPSTPAPLPRLGQGVATYAANASKPVRAASLPVAGQTQATRHAAPRVATLPTAATRTVPTILPPAVLSKPADLPHNGFISPPQNTSPTLNPLPATSLDANSQTAGRATNPLSAANSTDTLTVLRETARRRFQARQIAQNEIHYNYFSGGTPQEKLVALTFDDGPNPAGTPAVLDILKREGVPATFFLIGRNAEKHPELVLRELAEGHDIGNHSYHHYQRINLSLQEWRDEIGRTNDVIVNLIGAPTRWFRAPGCHYSSATLQAIQELGMVRVDTTNNSSDWDKRSADVISKSILERLAPGNVLLFHDPMPETARALPHLIHEIQNRGYRFVLLGDLALRAQATPGFQPAFRPLGQGIVISK